MMDFIYELYQNDNFVLYLTIALVILIILFVLVLIFGKRDQKLEETKRLQKIDVDAFKEEKPKEEVKVEVPNPETKEEVKPVVEEPKEEKQVVVEETPKAKSIFDDTQVLPISKPAEVKNDEEINVTTFEPTKTTEPEVKKISVEPKEEKKEAVKPLIDIEEEAKPINIKELDEINFDDINLEKDLDELENIKKEFNSIEIPKLKEEKEEKPVEEKKETKTYRPGPQVFSSVFVNKEEPKVEPKEEPVVSKSVVEPTKPKTSLFSIQEDDEETIELPPLKKTETKEETPKTETKTFSFDDITGETYNIK